MFWFTSDEHYGHLKVIDYSNRPFSDLQEMELTLIKNHNSVVSKNDIVIHAGDFSFYKKEDTFKIINKLNGTNIFLRGSHDYWLPKNHQMIWEKSIQKRMFVVCHYAMRKWRISHYNSIHLYGHSHGKLEPIGQSWDVGIDNNNYFPISENQIFEIMKNQPDNVDLIAIDA